MKIDYLTMENEIVSPEKWLAKRKELLELEKQITRLCDELSRKRRELPWECARKNYVFDGPKGRETLSSLFDGRSQLLIYHFMFDPEWEAGCTTCSLVADNLAANVVHLAARDVSVVVVSRAPAGKIEAFKKRMGWRFKWVSSFANDFNRDYHVSFSQEEVAAGSMYYNYGHNQFPLREARGVSVFYKNDAGEIFHTYSTYARGMETLLGAYHYLDLVPKGRDEAALPFPMDWLRHHDSYRLQPESRAPGCCLAESPG